MIRLVVFDLDGTLLDTRRDIAEACNYALRSCGCPERSLGEYNMLVGRGITNLFRGALPEECRSEEMVEKMRSFFVPYYNEHSCDFTVPYEGVDELLENIAGKGVALAIASNKYQQGTQGLVDRYFGRHSFAAVLGERPGHPIKPDPSIVLEAMEAAGVTDPDEVVYCGDSDVDMKTGIGAGVKTVGVTWGFRTREELEAYSPWMLADTAGQIYEALSQYLK